MTMVQNQLLGSLNGTVAALPQRTRGRYASDHTSSWNVHESWSEQLQSSTAPFFSQKSPQHWLQDVAREYEMDNSHGGRVISCHILPS